VTFDRSMPDVASRRIAPAQVFVVSARLASGLGPEATGCEASMQESSTELRQTDYSPSEDEPFMNERQLHFFKRKLLDWKEDILRGARETVSHLQKETENHPDLADRASSETDRALELRTRDRQRKLISKIDEALRRIDERDYGYCEETGEPIGIARLMARPIATLGLEAQERHERRERVHRDD
jgi:DnaK suppressor protein